MINEYQKQLEEYNRIHDLRLKLDAQAQLLTQELRSILLSLNLTSPKDLVQLKSQLESKLSQELATLKQYNSQVLPQIQSLSATLLNKKG